MIYNYICQIFCIFEYTFETTHTITIYTGWTIFYCSKQVLNGNLVNGKSYKVGLNEKKLHLIQQNKTKKRHPSYLLQFKRYLQTKENIDFCFLFAVSVFLILWQNVFHKRFIIFYRLLQKLVEKLLQRFVTQKSPSVYVLKMISE